MQGHTGEMHRPGGALGWPCVVGHMMEQRKTRMVHVLCGRGMQWGTWLGGGDRQVGKEKAKEQHGLPSGRVRPWTSGIFPSSSTFPPSLYSDRGFKLN